METKISEVTIIPVKPNKGLVALASCVIDDKLYLGSIGIYTKLAGGYRLTFPNKKVGDTAINIFHPINRTVGDAIENGIIEEYKAIMAKSVKDDVVDEEEI